jgi:hypothetical protein
VLSFLTEEGILTLTNNQVRVKLTLNELNKLNLKLVNITLFGPYTILGFA